MKVSVLIQLIVYLCAFDCFAFSQVDSKYLMAYSYLRSSDSLNNEIKEAFPKLTSKRCKHVAFNLSSEISFIDISYFEHELKSNSRGIDQKYIEDFRLYDKDYGFESFIDNSLNFLSGNGNRLYLTFSKPVKNHLLAELTIFDPRMTTHFKLGKAMQFLFRFDLKGHITEVLTSTTHYN